MNRQEEILKLLAEVESLAHAMHVSDAVDTFPAMAERLKKAADLLREAN